MNVFNVSSQCGLRFGIDARKQPSIFWKAFPRPKIC
jgi:hypothetical protein